MDDLKFLEWREGHQEVILEQKDTYSSRKKSKYVEKTTKNNEEKRRFEYRLKNYKIDFQGILNDLQRYKRSIHALDYTKYLERISSLIEKIKNKEKEINGSVKISIIAFRKRYNEILTIRGRLFPSEKEFVDQHRTLVNQLLN